MKGPVWWKNWKVMVPLWLAIIGICIGFILGKLL